jgi:SpoU rRNA methylase family enzyme
LDHLEAITNNGVTFDIDASNQLYYANTVNGSAFVQRLTVSTDGRILQDVEVRITVTVATGPISRPYSFTVGSLNSIKLTKENIDVAFDPAVLYQISDPQAGSITVEVLEADNIVAEAGWNIQVLPPNFWIDGGSSRDYLSLASFVQPNHPTVRTVLDEAVELMKKRGQSPSLSGYQNLPHVEEMAAAIYDALKARQINYSNPPASWSSKPGQKVRTAQEILEEKVGTCLDTAVLFASCLEQAGLEPVLFVVPGHAFVGYWTAQSRTQGENLALNFRGLAPVSAAGNIIDMDFIRLFETTLVCTGNTLSFAQACAAGKGSLEAAKAFGENQGSSFIINVVSARFHDGFDPMPARFVSPTGEVTIIEYVPTNVDLSVLRDAYQEKEGVTGNRVSLNVPPVVRKWLDSLLDLSLRNPLINFRDRATNLKLLVPSQALGDLEDYLQNDVSFILTHGRVGADKEGKAVVFNDETDRGEASQKGEAFYINSLTKQIIHANMYPDSLVLRLRKIYSAAKTFQEETGSNGLYLALGTLTWKASSSEVQSPLILVPVTLTAKNRNKEFHMSIEESGVTPNFSLIEKLKQEHNLKLDGLAELQTDKFGVDVEATLEYVRQALVNAGLNDFRVDGTATLGLFNFSSFRLWKDMLDNWNKFERNPLVKHLIHTPTEAFADPCTTEPIEDLDRLIAELPIPADGSQAQAVASAIAGKTFILQGPPGTGKSQTITNLLAKALDDGKRVLFVAEKKDALDVVKVRLDQCGIGAFSLDLHDKASTSKAVREQLADVLDILVDPDTIGYEAALQDYESALGPLKKYRSQLHEVGSLGESVYSAKDKFLFLASTCKDELKIPGEFIAQATTDQQRELLNAAKSVTTLGSQAGIAAKNPWSLIGNAGVNNTESLAEIKRLAGELDNAFQAAIKSPELLEFLKHCSSLEQLSLLKALKSSGLSRSAIEFGSTKAGYEQIGFTKEALENNAEVLSKLGYPTQNLKASGVAGFVEANKEADLANFLFKSAKKKKLYKTLAKQIGTKTPFPMADLDKQLKQLEKLEKAAAKSSQEIAAVTGLRFEDEHNFYDSDSVKAALTKIVELKSLSELSAFPIGTGTAQALAAESSESVRDQAHSLALASEDFAAALQASKQSEELWIGSVGFYDRFSSSVPQWRQDANEYGLAPLLRWTALLEAIAPFYTAALDDAANALLSGEAGYEYAANAFEKGFYRALFENMLVVQGLNSFDGVSINNFIRKLEESQEALKARLPKVLGAELLSRRGFDSSMKIGAIGDLMLAVKQSRNALPLRTLLKSHWDIITRITPCVLASPDSAVRFIDPSFEAFDLVVFDEASQIRVANAIGALGRAKAAVVVGDSEQMPPTSVAQTKVMASDDEEPEDDMFLSDPESILTQCEVARVPDIMLNWHYRSEDESLIAFSNERYYGGKLSTFPTPNLSPTERSLRLVQVPGGHFIRAEDSGLTAAEKGKGKLRTNPAEAKAIVDEVISRLESPATANDSIGIVTFNLQQRDLIQTMLFDSSNKTLQTALAEGVGGEPIFVKNLESVQGSERDAILFSIAFSAKKSDPKNLPLNFGPITQTGGHKRLNVAITRARKAVKIFCSFNPALLVDKDPTSSGLKDLGRYLAMAAAPNRDEIASLSIRENKIDRHRVDVAEALVAAGLPAIQEVGLSDFKVDVALMGTGKNPSAVLGILLDGPRWNSRTTVSDRDSLPVALLTSRMGWPAIERIWLPNWLRDKSGEIARIKESYDAALKAPRKKVATKTQKPKPIFTKRIEGVHGADQTKNPVDDLLEKTETWRPLAVQIIAEQDYLNYLGDKGIKEGVQKVVMKLAEIEGPVSYERIGKFVANCFGYNRVVPQRVAAINGVVSREQAKDDEGFRFPPGLKVEEFLTWKKSAPGEGRSADQISLAEISNAMRDICRVAGGVRFEQLVKETSKVFGIQKMSNQILTRFEAAVAWGISNGRLSLNGDYIAANS